MNDERLLMVKELGATQTINPGRVNAMEQIMEISGYGVDFALDTTGLPGSTWDPTSCWWTTV
jgi:aryl-alcohol dehydrogenase